MPRRSLGVTGFVLAGGRSRRMGMPKEKLVLEGETMLDRQIRLLRSVSRSAAVIGARASGGDSGNARLVGMSADAPVTGDLPVISDVLPGRGPLGGIYSGLTWTRTEFNLFLACDLPFVNARLLRYIVQRALAGGADVTIPACREGEYQPLCAVYRRRARRAIRANLARGQNKVTGFFPRVRCRVIPWSEVARAGFPPRVFDNMNTPEEYDAAKQSIDSA
jgi:molybdopterin-guanine dinucleotide biosynthesis protein A